MVTAEDIVKIPYTTHPGMRRRTGPLYTANPDPRVLASKQQEDLLWGHDLWGQIKGSEPLVWLAASRLGHCTDAIQELAMTREEDLAIVEGGRLVAIAFYHPSGFVPQKYLGWPLEDIHRKVADSDLLVRATPKIAQALTEQAWQRTVWTVTQDPRLSNHPNRTKPTAAQSLDDLYVRWELQTTEPLNHNSALFLVRVRVEPLKNWPLDLITASINSMSEAVLDYKNLRAIKSLINREAAAVSQMI